MIFVALGTWEMPFARPLHEIEQAVSRGVIQEPVIVQSGKTSFSSPQLELVPFFDREDLERRYEEASLVICQAGVGSIMLGLRKKKKVIAIARRASFDEHIDDHQLEILQVFAQLKVVLEWKGDGDLPAVLTQAKSFLPAEYTFREERISAAILEYLAANIELTRPQTAEPK